MNRSMLKEPTRYRFSPALGRFVVVECGGEWRVVTRLLESGGGIMG